MERRAWVCGHRDCVPPVRKFLRDEPAGYRPACEEHGNTMVQQANVRYGGVVPRKREGDA